MGKYIFATFGIVSVFFTLLVLTEKVFGTVGLFSAFALIMVGSFIIFRKFCAKAKCHWINKEVN